MIAVESSAYVNVMYDWYTELILLLRCSLVFAENYISYVGPHSAAVDNNDFDRLVLEKENGFLWDIVKPESEELPVNNGFHIQHNSEVDNTSHGWSDVLCSKHLGCLKMICVDVSRLGLVIILR